MKFNDSCQFKFGFEKERFHFENFDGQKVEIRLQSHVVMFKWQKHSMDDEFTQSVYYNATEYKVTNPCFPAKIVRSVLSINVILSNLNPNCGQTILMVRFITI